MRALPLSELCCAASSACGPKRTCRRATVAAAFGGKADMALDRTVSANDPYRPFALRRRPFGSANPPENRGQPKHFPQIFPLTESYTEPALFGSLQMRHAAANAPRSAYFQRDMVNCDPIATKYPSAGPTVQPMSRASPEKRLHPRSIRPPPGPTGRSAAEVRIDRRPHRLPAVVARAARDHGRRRT